MSDSNNDSSHPRPDPVEAIYAIMDGLAPLYAYLLPRELTLSQRRARSTLFFPDAERFVSCTAEVLAESTTLFPGMELFPDIPINPEELAARQRLADALKTLRGLLGALFRLSSDTYLHVQAGAVADAMSAVKKVRRDSEDPFDDDPRRPYREFAMYKAENYAPRRRRYQTAARLRKQAARRAAREAAASDAGHEDPGAPPPVKSPRKGRPPSR